MGPARERSLEHLPTGTVTFLLTDVVGSTAGWETEGDRMGSAMARPDGIIDEAVEGAGGLLGRPRGEGDSRFAVFAQVGYAAASALEITRKLAAEPFTLSRPIRGALVSTPAWRSCEAVITTEPW
jgi:class 3 adenylate cyclase